MGIPKALSGNRHYLTAKLFSVVRDLQVALGRLISLIDDARGLYLVQNGQFHNICYKAFQDYNPNLFPATAGEISLLDYRRKSKDEREACTKLGIDIAINKYEESRKKAGFSLTQFLRDEPDEVFEGLTLADLTGPFISSNLYCAQFTESKIGRMQLNQLNGMTYSQQKFIKKRMKTEMERIHQTGDIKKIYGTSELQDIFKITKENIAKNRGEITETAFRWFSNEQLEGLTLLGLDPGQARDLFILLEGEEIRKRLKLFSGRDILQAIYEDKIPYNVLQYLTISQKQQIDVSKMHPDLVSEIFSYDSKFLNQRILSNWTINQLYGA